MFKARNLLFVVLMSLMPAALYSQPAAKDILDRMHEKITGMGSYRADFSVIVGSETMDGNFIVSGENYKITTDQMVLYSDGVQIYEVNIANREILIDNRSDVEGDLLSDPRNIFDFSDRGFKPLMVSETEVKGRRVYEVSLDATGKLLNVTDLKVYISATDHLPVKITYNLTAENAPLVLNINSISSQSGLTGEFFIPEPASYPGYEIIDFR